MERKRDDFCIITGFHPEIITTTNSYGKEKQKPRGMEEYNLNMSGVDRLDQLDSYYSRPRGTIR